MATSPLEVIKEIISFKESLIGNAIHLIMTAFATSLLGVIFWAIVAKSYSPEDVGLASSTISSMNLLTMISLVGFNLSLIKFLPGSNSKGSIINSCFTLCVIITISISIGYLLWLNVWFETLPLLKGNIFIGIFFIIITMIWTISILLNSIFISERVAKYVFLKEIIFGVSKIPFSFFLIAFGSFGIILSWGTGIIFGLLIGYIFLGRVLPSYKPHVIINTYIIKNMLHFSLWNYLGSLFYNMSPLILPILITAILSPETAAYFYISWMIANLLFTVPLQATQSLFAEGSNLNTSIENSIRKCAILCFLILIPLIAILLICGDKILLIFGSEYSIEGFRFLQVLVISSPLYTIISIYVSVKRIKYEVRTVALIYGLMTAITLTGSYILLKDFSLIGIAYAWIIGNIAALVLIAVDIFQKGKLNKHIVIR